MHAPASLLDALYDHARAGREDVAFEFLTARRTVRERLSFTELCAASQSLADELHGLVGPGNAVPLVFAPGLSFIVALLACWQLRAAAVPLAPELLRRDPRASRELLDPLNAPCVLCDDSTAQLAQDAPSAPWHRLGPLRTTAAYAAPPSLDPDSTALVQYTSGSTGTPRAVAISHANLMANMEMIRTAFGHGPHSTVVGWAPLYHDQGLIGNVLQPLFLGARCALIAPQTFVRDPLLWPQLVSDYRAHTSGGPNFAYDLCVARFRREKLADVDLSGWKVAFNGAEPIRPASVARFCECFAPLGFDAQSMFPCYGLAEATLFVSGGPGRRATRIAMGQERPRVGCGRAAPASRIRIVNPRSMRTCGPYEIGEIWVAGPHVARSYWLDAEATRTRLRARLPGDDHDYLRSGDLGFLDDTGELFPAGRLKEVIIQHGRNFSPHDIESTVAAASDQLDPVRGVVFGVEIEGRERVIAVQELRREARAKVAEDEVVRSIRRRVNAVHGLVLDQVLLVRPHTLPFTTSGKKQRTKVREAYLAGRLASDEALV
jgi:acyl-CoA synthetase (AMP-forming)/AMP-acid ligase II